MVRIPQRAILAPLLRVMLAGSVLAALGEVRVGQAAPLAYPSVLLSRPIPTDAGNADIATNVLLIPGGALITGWTSRGGGLPDGLLLRVDPEGNVIWRRGLRGDGTDLLWAVPPDGGGGGVGVGFTSRAGAGNLDGWMIRFDAEGRTTWERTYGGPGEDRLTAMKPIPGGWIAVGQTTGRGAGGIDGLVVRVDRNGNEIGSWTSGGPGLDRAFAIQPTGDGGCVIAGMSGARHEESDAFVTRLGPDGQRVWNRTLERPGFGVAHDMHVAPNGELLIYGYAFVDSARGIDGFALRMNDRGEIVDESTFGGSTYDRANHAETFVDGSAVVVGYTQRPGATNEDDAWDLVIHALDTRGRPQWSGRFGGPGIEFGRSIAGSPEDLWIVGHTTTEREGSSVLLIRLDASSLVGGASQRGPARPHGS